jgi:hypothetical protein
MTKTRSRFNVGDTIGLWTILEYPYKSKKVLVRCTCGTQEWRWLSNFSSGKSKSCRQCLKNSPELLTYNHTKRTAVRRKIAWQLSFEQWLMIATEDCYYCGSPPANKVSSFGFTYNGVDRVDSTGTYEMNNCVASCLTCNRAKSNKTQKEFYEWVCRVYALI